MSGSESSTRIRTFPDWSESSGHCIRMTCDAHDGGDGPRKTTTGLKSGLKIKICLKSKFLPPSPDPSIADPGLGSGPKSGSGLIRWHQSGETDPWLVAGSVPDCVTTNQDRDTTYVGTGLDQLSLANDGKEKWPMLLDRKREATPKNTSKPKKKEV
jgi:hypothetical protein